MSTGLDEVIFLSEQISPILNEGTKGNPRQIKRFINSLLLRFEISKHRNLDDVKKRVVGNYLHEHLKASLDIKIPMLENKTPRQCVKTNKNLLIGWLMMMEDNINQQIPGGDYDISWAYQELGLKK